MLRSSISNKPLITKIGLGTFMDPKCNEITGCALNEIAKNDLKLVENIIIENTEYLMF